MDLEPGTCDVLTTGEEPAYDPPPVWMRHWIPGTVLAVDYRQAGHWDGFWEVALRTRDGGELFHGIYRL